MIPFILLSPSTYDSSMTIGLVLWRAKHRLLASDKGTNSDKIYLLIGTSCIYCNQSSISPMSRPSETNVMLERSRMYYACALIHKAASVDAAAYGYG